MADANATADGILAAISVELNGNKGPDYAARIRDLAEAYAWLVRPDQTHGGGSYSN